ncbi:MAG: CBS domain-containing protein [Thermoanaerobaculia bacterium]|nr:CBS domain-containing protein [Thermoanaerobaculia bacterium]
MTRATETHLRDLMTEELLTVRKEMSTTDLARFLEEHEISGAPVVDEDGRPVGVVSSIDLVRLASERVERPANAAPFYRSSLEDENLMELYGRRELPTTDQTWGDISVEDIMTPAVQSVPVDSSVQEVASIMVAGHFHRLLVEEDGELVGIVSSLDLLKVLAESRD